MSASDDQHSDTNQNLEESENDDTDMVSTDSRVDHYEEMRRHQPSIITFFPGLVEHNCVPDFQGREFNVDGVVFAFKMEHGLILQFNHIMGFFAEMVVRGYNKRMDELSPLAIIDLSKTASMILEVHFTCGMPFEDGQEREVLPKIVLSILVVKADVDPDDCSFFSAFYLAFRKLMYNESLANNAARIDYCKRVIANMGKSYPMCRHIISPYKNKRRPST